MDFKSSGLADQLVSGRECGTCTLCCKVYKVSAINKPEGKWCQYCTIGTGCTIYPDRPQDCRDFFCLWRLDASLPEEWKPERAKFSISIFPTNGFVYLQVDPGHPHAWRKEPYLSGLMRWSDRMLSKGRHLLVFVNSNATLMMPTGPVDMGRMSPEDAFVVRERFSANGKTYEVDRVAPRGPAEIDTRDP